jgi:Flp pilus assembly protein TadD
VVVANARAHRLLRYGTGYKMNIVDTILRSVILSIMVLALSSCATSGKIDDDTSKFGALRGSGSTYGDTQSIAAGGAASNIEAHAKARAALNKQDIDKALYYYVKALEFNPKDIPALMALARLHSAQGNIEPTILAYQLILEQEPNNIDAMEGAGLTLLKINRANQAKAMLEKANELAPDMPLTLMGIAVYYDLISDFDRANEYYQKAAKLAPKSVKILNNYAYSRYLAGDLEESENIYKKLLRQSPKHTQGLLNYGLLQARIGKTAEALHTLKKVLTESEAYNELGYIYMMQQDYGKARRLFELAISSSPTYFERASKNLEQLKLLVSRLTKTGTKKRNSHTRSEKEDEGNIIKDAVN